MTNIVIFAQILLCAAAVLFVQFYLKVIYITDKIQYMTELRDPLSTCFYVPAVLWKTRPWVFHPDRAPQAQAAKLALVVLASPAGLARSPVPLTIRARSAEVYGDFSGGPNST